MFRKSLGLSQRELAAAMGTSNATVAFIETDERTPSKGFLLKISDVYGVNADWLLNGYGEMLRPRGRGFKSRKVQIDPTDESRANHGELSVGGKDYAWVQRVGLSVSAGSGIAELPEEDRDGVFLPMQWFEQRGLNADLCVMVTVRGDSMAPSIPDGSLVMIDRAQHVLRAEGIYAFSLDGQSYVKRIVPSAKDKMGRPSTLMLISENTSFPPVALSGAEMNSLIVVGKVTAVLSFT